MWRWGDGGGEGKGKGEGVTRTCYPCIDGCRSRRCNLEVVCWLVKGDAEEQWAPRTSDNLILADVMHRERAEAVFRGLHLDGLSGDIKIGTAEGQSNPHTATRCACICILLQRS